MSRIDLEKIVAMFGDRVVLETYSQQGDETAVISKESLLDVMFYIKNSLKYDFLVDLTAVDRMEKIPRFMVVYHFRSMELGSRLRIKVPVDESSMQIDSIVPLWPAANWLEREAYDMFGVVFTGHPDLRRILLYSEFVGHPLRKDYPKDKRQPLVRREDMFIHNENDQ